MDYVVNELSLHSQFHSIPEFEEAIERLVGIRNEILRLGSSLFCHRGLVNVRVTSELVLQQAVQALPPARRGALMVWITRTGPHWEDAREHGENDWLEVEGQIVTDSAVGEAAMRCRIGTPRELVSFSPSDWLKPKIDVTWVREDASREIIKVDNHWELGTVQASLAANPIFFDSWASLEEFLRMSCTQLTISTEAFRPLEGHPYSAGAGERIRILMTVLDRLKSCFNDDGTRTAEGIRLYDDYFVGAKPWFTDSSDSERNDFETQLTFPHPLNPGATIFCPWHGKVKSPQYRVHFSWPISKEAPVYVVYIGPKITKK